MNFIAIEQIRSRIRGRLIEYMRNHKLFIMDLRDGGRHQLFAITVSASL